MNSRAIKTARFPDCRDGPISELFNIHRLLTTANKMIVRVQRFSRVHRLLPRIARRTLTEETPKVVSNDEILPSVGVTAPEPQETQRVGEMRKKDELRKKGIESLKEAVQKPLAIQDQLSRVQSSVPEDQNPANKVQQPLSEVHWALAEGYEAGGHLKYGTGLNRFDEKGLPTWGDWGVCVKIFDIGELTASPVLFLLVLPFLI